MLSLIHHLIVLLALNPIVLFDFTTSSDISKWRITDDVVMGGRSDGKFQLSANGNGLFSGKVSLENNGGFSSVRYYLDQKEMQGLNKFVIRIKGDGKNYQFRVRAKRNEYYEYNITFKTSGDWETIDLPFNQMTPSFRGRELNLPPFPGSNISEIGFLISNKKAETFMLEIESIKIQ